MCTFQAYRTNTMQYPLRSIIYTTLLCVSVVACGGGGDSGGKQTSSPAQASSVQSTSTSDLSTSSTSSETSSSSSAKESSAPTTSSLSSSNNQPPSARITFPRQDAKAGGKNITVRGVASDDKHVNRIIVNGVDAIISSAPKAPSKKMFLKNQ